MATVTTPEENARRVPQIYAHFNIRPGNVLRASNFVAVGSRWRIPISGIQIGLEYAAEMNWIEETENALRLTDAGFAAMPVVDRIHCHGREAARPEPRAFHVACRWALREPAEHFGTLQDHKRRRTQARAQRGIARGRAGAYGRGFSVVAGGIPKRYERRV